MIVTGSSFRGSLEQLRIQWPKTCYQNYMVCTNESWAVPASMTSRRFFVLEPDETYAGLQTDVSRA